MIGLKPSRPQALLSVLLLASQLSRGLIRLEVVASPPQEVERALSVESKTTSSLDSSHLDIPKLAPDFSDYPHPTAPPGPKGEIQEEVLQTDDDLSPQSHSLAQEPCQEKDKAVSPSKADGSNKEKSDSIDSPASLPNSKSEETLASKQGAGEMPPGPESAGSEQGGAGSSNIGQNTKNSGVPHSGDQLKYHAASNGSPEVENVGQGLNYVGHFTSENPHTSTASQPVPSSHSQLNSDAQKYHSGAALNHPSVPNQSLVHPQWLWQLHCIETVVPQIVYTVHQRLAYLPVLHGADFTPTMPPIHDMSYTHAQSAHSAHQNYAGESYQENLTGSSQSSNLPELRRSGDSRPPRRFLPPRSRQKKKNKWQTSSNPYGKPERKARSAVNHNTERTDNTFRLKDWNPKILSRSDKSQQGPYNPQINTIPTIDEPILTKFDETLPADPVAADEDTHPLEDQPDFSSRDTSPRSDLDSKPSEESFVQDIHFLPKVPQSFDIKHGSYTNQALEKKNEELESKPSGTDSVLEPKASGINHPRQSSDNLSESPEITPPLPIKISNWPKEVQQKGTLTWSQKVQQSERLQSFQKSSLRPHASKLKGLKTTKKSPLVSVPTDNNYSDNNQSLMEDGVKEKSKITSKQPKQEEIQPYLKLNTPIEILNVENPGGILKYSKKGPEIIEESSSSSEGILANHDYLKPNNDYSSLPQQNSFSVLEKTVPEQVLKEKPSKTEKQMRRRKYNKDSKALKFGLNGSKEAVSSSKIVTNPVGISHSTGSYLASTNNAIFNTWGRIPRLQLNFPLFHRFSFSEESFLNRLVHYMPSLPQGKYYLDFMKDFKSKFLDVVGNRVQYNIPKFSLQFKKLLPQSKHEENLMNLDLLHSSKVSSAQSYKNPSRSLIQPLPQKSNIPFEDTELQPSKEKINIKGRYKESLGNTELQPQYVEKYKNKFRAKKSETDLLELLGSFMQAENLECNTLITLDTRNPNYGALDKFISQNRTDLVGVKQLAWLIETIGKVEGRRRWEAILRQYNQPKILAKWNEFLKVPGIPKSIKNILDKALKISEPWPTFYDADVEEYDHTWVERTIKIDQKAKITLLNLLGKEELNYRIETKSIMKPNAGTPSKWLSRVDLIKAYQQGYNTNRIRHISNILQLGPLSFEPLSVFKVPETESADEASYFIHLPFYFSEVKWLIDDWQSKELGPWATSAERNWLLSDPNREKIYKTRLENLKHTIKHQNTPLNDLLDLFYDIKNKPNKNKKSTHSAYSQAELESVWWNLSDALEWAESNLDHVIMVQTGLELKIPQSRHVPPNFDNWDNIMKKKSVPEEMKNHMFKWFQENTFSPYQDPLHDPWVPIYHEVPQTSEKLKAYGEQDQNFFKTSLARFKRLLSNTKNSV